MRSRRANFAIACVALALSALSAEAAPPSAAWIAASDGRREVFSNTGEKQARGIALQAAEFDDIVVAFFPTLGGEGRSVVAFGTGDEASLRAIGPEFWERGGGAPTSFFASLPKQAVLGFRTDLRSDDNKKSLAFDAYRGLVAERIERAWGPRVPEWLGRGVASLLGDTLVREKDALVKRLPAPTAEVARAELSGGRGLFTSTALFRAQEPSAKKDALAQAFLHFLLSDTDNASRVQTFVASLAKRETPPASSLDALSLLPAFETYLKAKGFKAEKRPLRPISAQPKSRTLGQYEIAMTQAEILLQMNRPLETREHIREARALDGGAPRTYEIEGALYDAEQRAAEARQAYEAAVSRGTKNGAVFYRLAQMAWTRAMSRDQLLRIEAWLKSVSTLDPRDAIALAYLAEVENDLGRPGSAITTAARAAEIQASAYAHMAKARAQWNDAKPDAAIATARGALTQASKADKARIDEFLSFANANKKLQSRSPKPYASMVAPPPGSLGALVAGTAATAGAQTVSLGGDTRSGSIDASSITECFARRDDAACARAIPSLEMACAAGKGEACTSLGSLYDGGFGVRQDRRKAVSSYRSGCDAQDLAGCARFAVLEAQGLGTPKNTTRALGSLEKLCNDNVADACLGWGQLLAKSKTRSDRDNSSLLIKKACELGNTEACRLPTQ